MPVDLKIALTRGAEQLATHGGIALVGGEDRFGTALTRAQGKPTIALKNGEVPPASSARSSGQGSLADRAAGLCRALPLLGVKVVA